MISRRHFEKRPCQVPMLSHLLEHDRCALWAAPGLGKTSVTLSYISAHLMAGESHPTLILGPKRVARSTWTNEAQKWHEFADLSIIPIMGTEKERLAALRHDAPVFTTNYDNLVWLVEHFGERWPFRTVIADEATRVKGARISYRTAKKKDGTDGKEFMAGQGGKRAGALARIAHTHIKRFVELTGTPAPNGLVDLWGQAWFLDRGMRLGRTFDAFKKRWFARSYDGFSVEPLQFAEQQIYDAVKDICLTVDPKDWFDLDDPIVNTVEVDLPPKARQLYRDMEKEMYIQIEQHSAEAFNAAARTQKCMQMCIDEETEVLTDTGWKQLKNLAQPDMLWDGEEWVSFVDLTPAVRKPVIECDGVLMTPEHKVLTEGGWRTAKEIQHADAQVLCGFKRAKVRAPSGSRSRRIEGAAGDVAVSLRLRERGCLPGAVAAEQAPPVLEKLRVPAGEMERDARGVEHAAVSDMGGTETAGDEPLVEGCKKLLRKGYRGLSCLAELLRGLCFRYVERVLGWANHREDRQLEGVLEGELSVGNGQGAGREYANECRAEHSARADDSGGGGPLLRTEPRNPVGQDTPLRFHGRTGAPDTYAWVRDVVNAGRRHRFTVRGRQGQLLIVHNCSGAVYMDPLAEDDNDPRSKAWKEIHTEKIEALESIIAETNGAPLLVCYAFRSDLARLLKAFPKGRALNTTKDEDDFRAGKIPLLFIHPKSAGHGIDGFQNHCNVIVFFSIDWNLEERQQAIERIGPVRQMQADTGKPCYVYNIVARGTIDELVLERIATKRSVQDLLLEACKRQKGKS